MSYKYINRKNLVYYLHQKVKENGETEYFFSKQERKDGLKEIPEGYKATETDSGKAILVKK